MTLDTKKELYFGLEVDEAIAKFLVETDNLKRSKLFEAKIYPAFEKLAQHHYFKLPVARNEEVISECVVFLYEQLHKFDSSKASRGFPYFNIIAKNFFIQKLKLEKKEAAREHSGMVVSLNDSSTCVESLPDEDFEEKIETDQFTKLLRRHLPLWRDKFTKQHEKDTVDALIQLYDQVEDISLYKRKAVFFYLREMTGMNSKQIAINLNKIKKKFLALKTKYERGDY